MIENKSSREHQFAPNRPDLWTSDIGLWTFLEGRAELPLRQGETRATFNLNIENLKLAPKNSKFKSPLSPFAPVKPVPCPLDFGHWPLGFFWG